MIRKIFKQNLRICIRLAATCFLVAAVPGAPVAAQMDAAGGYLDESRAQTERSAADVYFYTDEEIETLVGPIALYPDDLVALVLPASTYPLQIVEAARFLERSSQGGSLDPPAHWDDSVFALLNYPDVVTLLNDDPTATWQLGEAVLNQRAEVLSAIERFRARAYDAGNLYSDSHQVVDVTDDYIEILPADPEVIYVPYYEPERVVVYQTVPVFHYYPRPYPVYYYPYPAGHRFRSVHFWGISNWFSIGWGTMHLYVHGHSHYTHPYYQHTYYAPFYRSRGYDRVHGHNPSSGGRVTAHEGNYRWAPGAGHGARPAQHTSKPRQLTSSRDVSAASVTSVRAPASAARPAVEPRDPAIPARTRTADTRARTGPVTRPSDVRKPQNEPEPAARERKPPTPVRAVESTPERRREQVPLRVDRSVRAPEPDRPGGSVARPAGSDAPSRDDGARRPADRSGDAAGKPARGTQEDRGDHTRRSPEQNADTVEKPARARQDSRGNVRSDDRERR